ncbi:hypothetical protein [Streptomyces filamentosus]|uniref:hypothetical protein n=1 Tax=Streptomyces filamentosus TaxID=67294 RepID=UPI0037D91440
MATSAVPFAIDALLEILRAAPALAGVQVIDGPPTEDQSVSDQLFVGWQPGDSEGASLMQDFAYAGARRRNETAVINCWIDVWSGDSSIRPRRLRAFELLAVVEDALRATDIAPEAPTLGGTVQWSQLSAGALQQSLSDQGSRAGLGFSVSFTARI